MDYVFFAFSAMSLGFSVLIFCLMLRREERRPLLRHLLLAAAVALAFFFLALAFCSRLPVLYYLANLLPQLLLLLSLTIYLWQPSGDK